MDMYICDEVIRTQTGEILRYQLQKSERRKVNDTGERTQRNLQLSLQFCSCIYKISETNDKIRLCVLHAWLLVILFSVLCLYLKFCSSKKINMLHTVDKDFQNCLSGLTHWRSFFSLMEPWNDPTSAVGILHEQGLLCKKITQQNVVWINVHRYIYMICDLYGVYMINMPLFISQDTGSTSSYLKMLSTG